MCWCMLCWWCYWGWPKPIADIYDDCVEKLGGSSGPLHWGPAHVVWADENWGSAQQCLDTFDAFCSDYMTEEQLAVVRESLERLVALPAEWKREPEGYGEGSVPEDFPPPAGWEMVKR